MMKATVFAVSMLASSVAMADALFDAPASGVRATYTLNFGGSYRAAPSHALALTAGYAAGYSQPAKTAELRWDRHGSELWIGGRPFVAPSAAAEGDDDSNRGGWNLSDEQALYLIAAAGAIGTAIVVGIYRDGSGPSGTGVSP